MKTEILKVDPVEPENWQIGKAASFVNAGGLVVFPTETVYGIGADAFNEGACRKIFEAKGRPGDNPLIVHVSSIEMAQEVGELPQEYIDRIRRVWPSPVTFIVKANKRIPKTVTGGLGTVALRMPAHPVALALISKSGCPIAAPSANPSSKPSATNAGQAIKYFDGKVDCIIDSGRAFFGVESTVIDLDSFTILRPGPFTFDEIGNAFGQKPHISEVTRGRRLSGTAVSPGTKYAHYAPDTRMLLFERDAASLAEVIDGIEDMPPFAFIGSNESCGLLSKEAGCSTIALGSAANLYEVAKNLYDGIIALDSLKVKLGISESFDENGVGLAIMNRLRKACSGASFWDHAGLVKLLES